MAWLLGESRSQRTGRETPERIEVAARSIHGAPSVTIDPFFAGLTPTYAGLYQVNVTIPSNAPKGTVNVTLGFNDAISNAAQITIQ